MKGWEKDPKKGLRKKKMSRNYPGFYLFILKKKKEKKKERDSAFIAV